MELLGAILIGAAAGWLAGRIMKSKSEGVVWNIILGIVGGFFGGWILQFVGFGGKDASWIASIITGTVGASLLIFINRKVFKR